MRASRKVTNISSEDRGANKTEAVMACDLIGDATMIRIPHFSGLPNFDITFRTAPNESFRIRLRSLRRNGIELRGEAKKATIAKISELLTLNGV